MKLDINIRILFSVLFLILLASTIYPTNSNAQTPDDTIARAETVECAGNGTEIITDPGEDSCELQPDLQKINFLRVDLCTAEPTAPTISVALDRSNCSTFFRNDEGSEVSVQQGVGTQIGTASDYTAIPHGTYTYGVVTMGTVFKYTASVTFSDTMTDTGGGGSTKTCVTRPGSNPIMYGWHQSQNAAQSNVSCAANEVASEISIGINTVFMDGNDCKHLLNFNGTNGIVAAYLLEADDTLHNDVPDDSDLVPASSSGCSSGTNNEVSKIMGVMTLATPIEIGANTAGMQIKYNNTRSLKIDLGGDSKIYKWDIAFFDFTLTAKKARSRGAWR